MKPRREGEQQPLPEDSILVNTNIEKLEDQANALNLSIKYGFNILCDLQAELKTIFEKDQSKTTYIPTGSDAPAHSNFPTNENAPTTTDGR
ncbi:unnamed protein product [Rotaria sordida]|nr:unnamed protein product [Rotaria sordida]